MEPNFVIVLFVFGLNIAFKGNANMRHFAVIRDIRRAEQPSNVTSPDCFTRLSRWRPAGSSNQPEGIFGRRKKFTWVSRILFYAKYLLFSIFRAFSAIFTVRVEDPFKNGEIF